MERAEQLIEKLRLQLRSGEPREGLLTTLRILYAEIRDDPSLLEKSPQHGPVAVILPSAEGIESNPSRNHHADDEILVVQPLEVDERELEAEMQAIREAADFRNASAMHLLDPVGPPTNREPLEPASVNDSLVTRERDVSDRLAEEPLYDIRTAVSLNDRFRFVDELFDGDQDLYEEAMRVLNEAPSLEKAAAWLESECFGRLGWNREDDLCAQFAGLVRRRFL